MKILCIRLEKFLKFITIKKDNVTKKILIFDSHFKSRMFIKSENKTIN